MRDRFIEILIVIVFVDALAAWCGVITDPKLQPWDWGGLPVIVFALHILQLTHFHRKVVECRIGNTTIDHKIQHLLTGRLELFELLVLGIAFGALIMIPTAFSKGQETAQLCIRLWTLVYIFYFFWDLLVQFCLSKQEFPRVFCRAANCMLTSNLFLAFLGLYVKIWPVRGFSDRECLTIYSCAILAGLFINYCVGWSFFTNHNNEQANADSDYQI